MVVHVQSTITKREDMTKEQFDKYWSETHGSLFMKNPIAQQLTIKYTQAHFDSNGNKAFAAVGVPNPSTFDGIANFWFASIEDAQKVFSSEYYVNIVIPDEERFVQRDKTTIFVTNDEDKWVDGKAGPGVFL